MMDMRLSPLATPTATREVLEAHGLATKKALGQNFLVNDAVLRKIVGLAELLPADDVLEVGPGIGTLTIALLKSAGRVVSVERDSDLPAVLAETCAPWADSFTLLNKDALDLQPADLPFAPSKLVANLPYAVAATVVLDVFERFESVQQATVMVQAEVADRMAANPGTKNYGAYTVKLRQYVQPAGRFPVSPGNFFPPPRVDSAVIRLDRIESTQSDAERAATCMMADAAFATRRKTIANSCKTYFSGQGARGAAMLEALPRIFAEAGIDPKRRGESLTLEEFQRLGKAALNA
jgi:16S rRNA (adenine1518-N6/adenine1519-N6)-dimethyltransferase